MTDCAFVLGAGLGTRLRPLTDDLPKPLVPIIQKPLITFALDQLAAAGVRRFVINTHHLPEAFKTLFAKGDYRGRPVQLSYEPVLLETGGGTKNAESLIGDAPFVVYSGDVLTDLPLAPLFEEHVRRRNDVTLALRETGLAAQVAFRDGRVLDIGQRLGHPGQLDYANVSIWSPSAFARFSLGEKISFIPVLVDWIRDGGRIGGLISNEGAWSNLGSPAQYLAAQRAIIEQNWRPSYLQPNDWPIRCAADAVIDPSATIDRFSVIGAGCSVEAGATLEESVLWPGAQIASRTILKRCIVRASRRPAAGSYCDAVL